MWQGDVICSPLGNFTGSYSVANPVKLVPRNYLTMPGVVSLNMRVYRVFGFGPVASGRSGSSGGGYGGFGGGPGFRMGGGGARVSDSTEHRFNLTLGVNLTNVLNHFNPGGYSGNITSPYFLQPTSVNTAFGGGPGGGGSNANNRRIEFQSRLTF